MSSETITSPIIITSPGSTRIFRNDELEKDNVDLEIDTNKKSCCCGFFTCCRCCSSFRIPTKRFFLPLLSLLYFVSLENTQHYVFFPLIIAATSFIVFYNFPFLVYYSNTKPLYYEDLFIDTSSLPIVNLDSKIRKNFENTFEITLVTTNALLLGALSDYWIYRTEEKHAMIEVIGITGGILKIFQFINNVIGSLILYILSVKIDRTVKKNEKYKIGNDTITNKKISKRKTVKRPDFSKNIEMISIHDAKHVINTDDDEEVQYRLPIINENRSFNHYDDCVVERMQLPNNIVKRTRRFKKINEMNKIDKMKQYDREEIERKEKLIRIKEDKYINRNVLITQNIAFERVGRKSSDSPHPLKNLSKHLKNQSEIKIEKNFNRINSYDQDEDADCVIVDVPSPASMV